ncbi:translation initiation factor IF-2-like [Cuculus canorus]|uniref:translation initiation factor IF-2-like n=1 Tax=Cuculus canorus TaxID=55661 RepID=UPI0023AAB589|nr:translation initiation factor IF-2-like [Cuculus canorus]
MRREGARHGGRGAVHGSGREVLCLVSPFTPPANPGRAPASPRASPPEPPGSASCALRNDTNEEQNNERTNRKRTPKTLRTGPITPALKPRGERPSRPPRLPHLPTCPKHNTGGRHGGWGQQNPLPIRRGSGTRRWVPTRPRAGSHGGSVPIPVLSRQLLALPAPLPALCPGAAGRCRRILACVRCAGSRCCAAAVTDGTGGALVLRDGWKHNRDRRSLSMSGTVPAPPRRCPSPPAPRWDAALPGERGAPEGTEGGRGGSFPSGCAIRGSGAAPEPPPPHGTAPRHRPTAAGRGARGPKCFGARWGARGSARPGFGTAGAPGARSRGPKCYGRRCPLSATRVRPCRAERPWGDSRGEPRGKCWGPPGGAHGSVVAPGLAVASVRRERNQTRPSAGAGGGCAACAEFLLGWSLRAAAAETGGDPNPVLAAPSEDPHPSGSARATSDAAAVAALRRLRAEGAPPEPQWVPGWVVRGAGGAEGFRRRPGG